jgi:hypothetical protein
MHKHVTQHMKKTFLLLLTILLISCNSKSQSNSKNGIIENGIYTCNLFEWKIKIPENYTVRTLKQKEDLEEVGYDKVKKETPDGVTVRKNRPHLIGFGLDDKNYFSSSLESLKGTKILPLPEHQKFLAKLTSDTYSKINGIEFNQKLSSEKIGKYDFYKIESEIYNQKTSELLLTQVVYNTYIDENLFSISINYSDEKVNKVLTENFVNSLTE